MFTPVCGRGRCVLHILFKKAWQVRREECLFTSAWLNRLSFHAWGWKDVPQLGGVRAI